MESRRTLVTPGLGETQRELLLVLKRRGTATLTELTRIFDLTGPTLRGHLSALEARGLVARAGTERDGPGRPRILYALSERGERLFPQGDADLLAELVRFLLDEGGEPQLARFFAQRAGQRRERAIGRTTADSPDERLDLAAELMSEAGYMAEVDRGGPAPVLRMCHCPLRAVVAATDLPCRSEQRFVEQLLGRPLERVSWMPDGDASCSYRFASPDAGEP